MKFKTKIYTFIFLLAFLFVGFIPMVKADDGTPCTVTVAKIDANPKTVKSWSEEITLTVDYNISCPEGQKPTGPNDEWIFGYTALYFPTVKEGYEFSNAGDRVKISVTPISDNSWTIRRVYKFKETSHVKGDLLSTFTSAQYYSWYRVSVSKDTKNFESQISTVKLAQNSQANTNTNPTVKDNSGGGGGNIKSSGNAGDIENTSGTTNGDAGGFVPCGNTADNPCQIGHLFSAFVVIVNYLIAMAGFIAVIAIVYAGFMMVYSQGQEALKEAKGRLSGAVIGLVLVAAAFVLINAIFAGSLSIGVRNGGSILTSPLEYILSTPTTSVTSETKAK